MIARLWNWLFPCPHNWELIRWKNVGVPYPNSNIEGFIITEEKNALKILEQCKNCRTTRKYIVRDMICTQNL